MTGAMGVAGAGAVIALIYQTKVNAGESALRSGLKTVPVALFAIAALLAGAPWLLVLGLALGAVGDFALSRKGDSAFIAGLGSFALAHLAYAVVFVGVEARLAPFDLTPMRWLGVAALVIMAQSTVVWLLPHVGGMKRPVAAYVAIISAMGLAALHLPATHGLAMLGAGLFVLSDLVLSIERFRMKEDSPAARGASHLVWPLYWVGQGLILVGIAWS
ncbi:lysoplasmalogenase [Nioella aestuarii]|uniref:lysoplasmalogenase n=1 Tax=Nioella aestuarii TaxID=1662864 RepID=UPI003D7F9E91